ncbi:helix-turn-helix transcriptional regulator [Fodinicola acaciae]|uniref:helix-turn-helix transcriptional regulator n=1 Tax=Fodinicola acaciae TaxID=2681555 RepID=UPI0013D0E46D|nr:LuxR family transcriptional regulator [Fodinicola acaciae]
MPPLLPVIGRMEELDTLLALLDQGTAGVVVAGEAGVGKTRLIRELLRRVEAAGHPVRSATATASLACVPFGVFANLVPTRGNPAELLTQAVEVLGSLNGERRLVLAVDDAHLLDGMSAGVLQLVTANRAAFVVVTVRSGEPVPDAVRALWKDEHADLLELQPLSRSETGELAATLLGGHPDADCLRRLWEISRGSPLVVREVVAVGRRRNALVERHGVWSWPGDVLIGTQLSQLVEDRLKDLTPEQRSALELVALAEPVGLDLVGASVDTAVLESLEVAGLLTSAADGLRHQVQVAHPLYAETVRQGLVFLRRRGAYRKLAEALAAVGCRRRDDQVRLALWQVEAGVATDRQLLAAAASQTLAVYEHSLAERLARAARSAGPYLPADLTLAQSLQWQGRFTEAQDVLDAVDLDAATPGQIADHAIIGSGNSFFGHGLLSAAEAELQAAQRRLSGHPEQTRVIAHRITLEFTTGEMTKVLATTDELLRIAAGDAESRVWATFMRFAALSMTGRMETALAFVEPVEKDAAEFPRGQVVVANIVSGRCTAYRFIGDLDTAESLAEAGYQQTLGWRGNSGWWPLVLGQVASNRGQMSKAATLLREATAALVFEDMDRVRRWALSDLAQALAHLGDLETARSAVAEADSSGLHAYQWLESGVVRAKAWIAAAESRFVDARRLAATAADIAATKQEVVFELEAAHDALRLGDLRAATRIRRIATGVEGKLAPAYTRHAIARAAGDAASLQDSATEFANLGMLLLAAEAAAEAANAYRLTGDKRAEIAVTEQARAWLTECGTVRTPALAPILGDHPLTALTAREREIAQIAAANVSSKAIADQLRLSVRTVDNHLARVYQKLNITGRSELIGLFKDPG